MVRCLPTAQAAFESDLIVDGNFGSRMRSTAALLVANFSASFALFNFFLFISFSKRKTKTLFAASASAASNIPSSRRKSSKLDPLCLDIKASFLVTFSSLKSGFYILLWGFLGLLDNSMQKNHFPVYHFKENASYPIWYGASHLP
jgi:hypothetical protein